MGCRTYTVGRDEGVDREEDVGRCGGCRQGGECRQGECNDYAIPTTEASRFNEVIIALSSLDADMSNRETTPSILDTSILLGSRGWKVICGGRRRWW